MTHFHDLVWVCLMLSDQSFSGDHSLSVGQELALLRSARHDKGCGKGDQQSQKAFEEEYVSPGVDAHRGYAPGRDARQPSRQKPSKGSR